MMEELDCDMIYEIFAKTEEEDRVHFLTSLPLVSKSLHKTITDTDLHYRLIAFVRLHSSIQ